MSVDGPLRPNGRPKIALKLAKQRNFDWLLTPLNIGNVIIKDDSLKVQTRRNQYRVKKKTKDARHLRISGLQSTESEK